MELTGCESRGDAGGWGRVRATWGSGPRERAGENIYIRILSYLDGNDGDLLGSMAHGEAFEGSPEDGILTRERDTRLGFLQEDKKDGIREEN